MLGKLRGPFAVLALASSTALAGCTGGLMESYRQPGQPPSLQAASGGAETGISGAYSRARRAVADALTITPRVIPADDPTRLDSKPQSIHPDLYVQAAKMYEQQGRFEESAQKYQQALEVDPNHFNGLIGYARLCDRQNDYNRAVSLYRKAIEVDDSDGRAWNDLGLCHARHEQLDKSWQALQQAVQRAPQRTLYRNNIASVLLQLDRHEEAVEHLLAVHEPAVAYYNTAYLVHQRGDKQAARYYLAAALEQDPQCAPARQLLAQLEPARSTPAVRPAGDTQANSARPAQRRVGDAQPTHSTGRIAGQTHTGNVSSDHAQILQPRISWRMQSEGEEAPRPKRLPPLPEQERRGRLAQMPDSGNALVVPDEEDRGNTPHLLPPVR